MKKINYEWVVIVVLALMALASMSGVVWGMANILMTYPTR